MDVSKLKPFLFALVPTLVLLLVGGALAEIFLRSRHETPATITGVTGWQLHESDGLTYAWDAYHPRLGWTNAPDYRSDARVPYAVTINGQGLRAPRDYIPAPPPGRPGVPIGGAKP